MSQRPSPGHVCGLCGVRDWGYDEYVGRWVCLNCAHHGVPIPPRPDFNEAFDFDVWHDAVQQEFSDVSRQLAKVEAEPVPEGAAAVVIHKAELKRLNREYDTAYDMSTVAMFLKQMRQMAIAQGGDFYINLPACSLQIRFNGAADS